jgi:AcrR family transcriptional regulator
MAPEPVGDGARMLRADARNNRARILAAARDVFVEQGPGAPLEDISRRAGTGIATLYRRFPDRQALMQAVVIDALHRTAEEARRAAAEETDPFAALARYMHRALDVRIAAVIPALLDEISLTDEDTVRARQEGIQIIQDLIERAQRAGTLRPDITFGDIGLLIVRLSRPLPGSFPREVSDELGHRHLDVVIDGLRTTAERGRLAGPGLSYEDLRQIQSAPLWTGRPGTSGDENREDQQHRREGQGADGLPAPGTGPPPNGSR